MTRREQPPETDPIPRLIPVRRRIRYRLLTGLLVAAVGCVFMGATEWVLRTRQQRIQHSDVIEPGLLRHDDLLGWKLSPYARSSHHHHDFSVRYTINSQGFRGDEPNPTRTEQRLNLFVGDSFTFGLGVNDDETFVHRLNKLSGEKDYSVNCGVPGYSTDQETLMIERDLLKLQPAVVWLVVYLANDLLDNQREVPFQLDLPKPHFELASDELLLKGTPVPQKRSVPEGDFDLATTVLGEDYVRKSWRLPLARRSFLFRALNDLWPPQPDIPDGFHARLGTSVELFAAILGHLRKSCFENQVKLIVVLLPGRSFVDQPESISARYQDYFRRRLLALEATQEVRIIDLCPAFRAPSQRDRGKLFYPHDGHLTPAGHSLVAEELLACCE